MTLGILAVVTNLTLIFFVLIGIELTLERIAVALEDRHENH